MEQSFWLQRWESRHIAFHKSEVNPGLVNYLPALELPSDSRILLPLCGKTLDIHWLLAQGYPVVGVEWVEMAVQELFAELGVEPEISRGKNGSLYQAAGIDVFVGDILEMTPDELGTVNAIYDRAALVALPHPLRHRYTRQLMMLTDYAPQLLMTFEYDQSLMAGPPFSIEQAELEGHYSDRYHLSQLHSAEVPGGLKGTYPAQEKVWLLQPKPAQSEMD